VFSTADGRHRRPRLHPAAQNGKPINLKDYRQKWVVLYFSPYNYNENGTIEADGFQKDIAKYAQANARSCASASINRAPTNTSRKRRS